MNLFKTCPCCSTNWKTLDEFLNDKELCINGYQADVKDVMNGLLIFTHNKPGCQTSLSIPVTAFQTILEKQMNKTKMTTDKDCKGYCLNSLNLEDCKVPGCEGYFIRKFIVFLKERDKNAA